MRKSEKEVVVAEMQQALRGNPDIILLEYRGLTVKAMQQLRRAVAAAGGSVRVIKNRLLARALGDGAQAGLKEFLTGPIAVALAGGRPLAVLKEIAAFARTNERLKLRAGVVEQRLFDGAQLAELAELPPRDELLARLAGSLSAPLSQLVSALQAVPTELVLTLQALAQQREGTAAEAATA